MNTLQLILRTTVCECDVCEFRDKQLNGAAGPVTFIFNKFLVIFVQNVLAVCIFSAHGI